MENLLTFSAWPGLISDSAYVLFFRFSPIHVRCEEELQRERKIHLMSPLPWLLQQPPLSSVQVYESWDVLDSHLAKRCEEWSYCIGDLGCAQSLGNPGGFLSVSTAVPVKLQLSVSRLKSTLSLFNTIQTAQCVIHIFFHFVASIFVPINWFHKILCHILNFKYRRETRCRMF